MSEINDKPRYSRMQSLVYNFLLQTYKLSHFRLTAKLTAKSWDRLWIESCRRFSQPVKTKIHGHTVIVNYGYMYPLIARQYNTYNNPLIELVYQVSRSKGSAITIVDVGAAVGDTMLLLLDNCPGMIDTFFCIEGYPNFFRFLQYNLQDFKEGILVEKVLSSSNTLEHGLVHTHLGSAASLGNEMVAAETLDEVLSKFAVQSVDIIKTDVEGFDGRVILGSKEIIGKHLPAVIFEWHPILCEKTTNDWRSPFNTLSELGYSIFVWFDKFGNFTYLSEDYTQTTINLMASLCLSSKAYPDWHYDIVALHKDSCVSAISLAELSFAINKKSEY